ncbi:unnamed protein product [Lampetra planeri]
MPDPLFVAKNEQGFRTEPPRAGTVSLASPPSGPVTPSEEARLSHPCVSPPAKGTLRRVPRERLGGGGTRPRSLAAVGFGARTSIVIDAAPAAILSAPRGIAGGVANRHLSPRRRCSVVLRWPLHGSAVVSVVELLPPHRHSRRHSTASADAARRSAK